MLLEWGVEAAGNWQNLYGQGGYFNFDVDPPQPACCPIPLRRLVCCRASWVLTGESKSYRPELGAYGLPEAGRITSPSTRAASARGNWRPATAIST